MMTNNIDVLDGLVDGAVGVLKYSEWEPDGEFPARVWLKFVVPGTGLIAAIKGRAEDSK